MINPFTPRHLVSVLRQKASRTPNRNAYLVLGEHNEEKEKITYRELDRRARAIATFLQTYNVFGQRVLLAFPAGIDFITAFMGCLYAGAIAVPVSLAAKDQVLAAIAEDAKICGILTTNFHLEKMKNFSADALNHLDIFIADVERIDASLSAQYHAPKLHSSMLVYLQYTSGSTASPKGVMITHENLIHSLKYSAKIWRYKSNSITLTWAPHSHVYGLVCGLLLPLYHGTLSIIMQTQMFVRRPVSWLEAITRYQVTHSGCPNFGFQLCVDEITQDELKDLKLGSWQVAINGGENVQYDTLMQFTQKFQDSGFRLHHFSSAYGMSEMAGAIAATPYGKKPTYFNLVLDQLKNDKVSTAVTGKLSRRFMSSGCLLPGLEALIVNPETLTLSAKGHIGEIWLRGPTAARGYWQREDETRGVFHARVKGSKHEYFRTGDLGFIEKNEICLTGRLKEILIVNGKKYYPHDLEKTIGDALHTFKVNRARAAISIEGAQHEEILILQEIELTSTTSDLNDINNMIRHVMFEQYGIDLYAVIFVPLNSLPKTISGKLQRKHCQQQFVENKLQIIKEYSHHSIDAPRQVPTPAALLQTQFTDELLTVISQVLKVEKQALKLNQPLSEYHFNSINIIKLTAELNEQYHLNLTPANLFGAKTINDFIAEISCQLKEGADSCKIDVKPEGKDTVSDIAIIGMQGIFPGAANLNQLWQNLMEGIDAIQEIPKSRWDWETYKEECEIKWGGFIENMAAFDAAFFHISPKEAELMDPQQRLLLQVVFNTIEDAGYSLAMLSTLKTGLYVGVFSNDYSELLQQEEIIDAYMTTGLTRSLIANRISYHFNFTGPSEVIDTACSSSLVAIHHAVLALQQGDCNVAIVGGVNALLSPTSYLTANKAGMLSASGKCSTFDKNANGYVRAEGVAALFLKPLSKAMQDNDFIYGVIKGTAINHGGHASNLTAPNPHAQAEVITRAMHRAGVDASSITYIETHGTGTPLGDPIEINGLKEAWANNTISKTCALGAIKTHIGHLESAAGIAGVVKVMLAFKHHMLPANLHFNELNPYIQLEDSPFYILQKNETWEHRIDEKGRVLPRRAGVSSFGFGGTNAHIVLEEAPHRIFSHNNVNVPTLIVLSAKTENALHTRALDLLNWLQQENNPPTLEVISYILSIGREHFEKRSAFVVHTHAELEATLIALLQNQSLPNIIQQMGTSDTSRIATIFQEVLPNLIHDLERSRDLSLEQWQQKLLTIGNFYTEGFDIPWNKIFTRELQKWPLPTYPFAQTEYWIPSKLISPLPHLHGKDTVSQVQKDLMQLVSRQLKMNLETSHLYTPLSDLGFDSLAFKEFATVLEQFYGFEFNPAVFFTHTSMYALSQYIFNSVDPVGNSANRSWRRDDDDESIAIVGMQAYLPQSDNLEEFWHHLAAGHDLITEVPSSRWNWQQFYGDHKQHSHLSNSKWGGFLPDADKFDAKFFNISVREANLMDPQQRLFLEICWRTVEDAGYDPHTLSGKKIGVFAGVEFNDYQHLVHESKKLFHGHVATGNSHALIANRISYFFNFKGPSEVIDTACSSSLVALHRAAQAIRASECQAALVGGVSLMLNPDTFIITSQMGALSSEGRCKTFDKSANGYVKGEGVACVMLKTLKQAYQDGDDIYGILKGSAVNHGGKAQSLTAPNALAQSELIIDAYEKAHIDPATISYIETHGTGTELGDPIEIEGLKQAFAKFTKRTAFCGIGSVKTNIGHLEPASGIVGMIKVLLAFQHQKLPAHLHFQELNPYIRLTNTPFYIVDQAKAWAPQDENGQMTVRRAGVSSFGFGGTNAHIVLEEAPPRVMHVAASQYYLITLSAKQEVSLQQKAKQLSLWLRNQTDPCNLANLSFTLNAGKAHFDFRWATVVNSTAALLEALDQLTNITLSANDIPYEVLFASMKKTNDKTTVEYRDLLLQFAKHYLNKSSVDWTVLYTPDEMQRLSGLPPYPFVKERYWFDAEIAVVQPQTHVNDTTKHNTENYLRQIFAEKLKINADDIQSEDTYEIYGVDSLLGLEITNRLEVDYGTLPKTLLYEKNCIRDLAIYLDKRAGSPKLTSQPKDNNTPMQTADEDIAIIGMSGIFPGAKNIDEFWQNLMAGKNCIGEVPKDRWDYKDFPVKVGSEEKYFKFGGFIENVDQFDPLFFNIAPKDAALMDPQERIFLESAWTTLEDAGYTRETLANLANNEVGVFAGVTYNFYPLFIAEEWAKGHRIPLDIQLFSIANRVSYFLNLKGPSFVIDTACSSSLAAIHLAAESIQRGECKMALAGGVNLTLHPAKYHMLGSYGFMSDQGRCASFAEGGAGYVPSEGVGCVLLKPLSLAQKDGDTIYGVIKVSTMNHGGKTSGYTVPNPNAQADLIKTALEKGKIDPRTITYIEAHGTGTALGDPIEIRGLQNAFEEFTQEKQYCAIGSVKSNIGHLESAAGISQLIKVLLQMRYQKLVPSIHAENLNPFIDFANSPFYVQKTVSDWIPFNNYPRRAGLSSFGAGGSNVHLIVEEFPLKNISVNASPENPPYLFLLSAMNAERLTEYVRKLLQFLEKNSVQLPDLCYTSQVCREPFSYRLAILIQSQNELIEKLKNINTQDRGVWISTTTDSKPAKIKFDEHLQNRNYAALAELWVQGIKIPWKKLYELNKPRKVYFPTYPFAKRRCWVPTLAYEKPAPLPLPDYLQDWTYHTVWKKAALQTSQKSANARWLIVSDEVVGKELRVHLSDSIFYDAHDANLQTMIRQTEFKNLKGIIYLGSLDENNQSFQLANELLLLLQCLIQQNFQQKLQFFLVTRSSQIVLAQDPIQVFQHSLWSMTRIFAREQGQFQVGLLDLDPKARIAQDVQVILQELQYFQPSENHMAYRNDQRYVARLQSVNDTVSQGKPWKAPEAALITGGLGALGGEVALWLATQGTRYLLLLGQTNLPDRNEWNNVQNDTLKDKISILLTLEQQGVTVDYVALDVTQEEEMRSVITQAEKKWGKSINGVFHLAGMTTDSISLDKLTSELLQNVLAAKAKGAWVLHRLFNKPDMNCFVLFSSIASAPFFGMSGLSAYAMANEFLNGLAALRVTEGLPAMSLSWAAWAEKGMSHRYNHSKFLDAVGMSTISVKQGIKILADLMLFQPTNVTIFQVQWEKFLQVNAEARKLSFFEYFAERYAVVHPKKVLSESLSLEKIKQQVTTIIAQVLELETSEINPAASYQDYGMDSIIGINFVSKLDEHFTDIVSPMDLYRYPSVNQLVDYIYSNINPVNNIEAMSEAEVSRLIENELADVDRLLE